MKYNNIMEGTFVSRPNRFIAIVNVNGKDEICHVKNTGRLKELLKEGVKVYVQHFDTLSRKTKYDLIAVVKENSVINIDSQLPNKLFFEWVKLSGYFNNITLIKPEHKYKNSRFDFYIETEKDKFFIEVKGVTLENNGIASFPDAPTERGLKHINELVECVKDGYKAYVFFICKIDNVSSFEPNRENHPEFADALEYAQKNGVTVKCLNCSVTPDTVCVKDFIKVNLNN